MTPTKHPNCNDVLKAPIGSENCEDLHIQRDDDSIWSFWRPSAEELAAIVMGGEIAVRVMENTYPPVWIGAMIPSKERKTALSPEESRAISDTIRERHRSLMTLTKRAMSMLAKAGTTTPERQRLFDQFLDMATINHASGEVVRDPVEVHAEPAAVTQADVDRYRSDAAEWRAEAARWRALSEAKQMDIDRLEGELRAEIDRDEETERLRRIAEACTCTQKDIEIAQWKGEAERWRKVAEELTAATAVDSEAFKDAAQWQAEAERLEGKLRAVSNALGDEWNMLEATDAITAIKRRLVMAEDRIGRALFALGIPNPNHPN